MYIFFSFKCSIVSDFFAARTKKIDPNLQHERVFLSAFLFFFGFSGLVFFFVVAVVVVVRLVHITESCAVYQARKLVLWWLSEPTPQGAAALIWPKPKCRALLREYDRLFDLYRVIFGSSPR